MALERTLSIIKPDAVAKNVIGEIYARFEKAGLQNHRGADETAFAAAKPKAFMPCIASVRFSMRWWNS